MTMHRERQAGFSLLEIIIGMGVLVIVSSAIYLAYANTLDIVSAGQYYSAAANIVESEVEIIRNMRYEDLGTVGGIPNGVLEPEKTVTLNQTEFTVLTFVRNIDDPFDGTLGGVPDDTDPADYKLVEIQVVCDMCARFTEISMTTTIAPRNLESPDLSGNLIVQVYDALGQPLPGATITVNNTSVTPVINLTDTSDENGQLSLVGVPSSSAGYRITVSRVGYSTDRTYPPDEPSNPNPTKPDVTVAEEQLTFASFAIDRTASFTLSAVDALCSPVSAMDLLVTGDKLIGTSPDIPKYSVAHATSADGTVSLPAVEWGSYALQPSDTSYAVAATSLSSPVILDPDDSLSLTWYVTSQNPSSLLVTVTDDTGAPVNDAVVRVSSGSVDETVMSGRFDWSQNDWTGGQFSGSSGINTASGGVLTLAGSPGSYATGSYAWLESETIDFGATTTFYDVDWDPSSQPAETGPESVRFQVAANNDQATWNYVGPDGTAGTFFSSPGTSLPGSLSGNRFVRYRLEMRTEDADTTPSVTNVSLRYRSTCLPGGGAYFSGLPYGMYTVSVTGTSFQDYIATDIPVLADWQEYPTILEP